MYGEYFKHLIFFVVAPTEALFIPSPLVFDGLHNEIFCCMALVFKKLQLQKERNILQGWVVLMSRYVTIMNQRYHNYQY